jgi:hypothetical protein
LKNSPPLQTKEANKRDTVAESHDDISEAFTLLQSAKMKINSTTVTELTKTATTPGTTTENVGFGPEERKAKLIKVEKFLKSSLDLIHHLHLRLKFKLWARNFS